jgi:hypothetical protein
MSEKRSPASDPSIMKRTPMDPRKPSFPSPGPTIFTGAAVASNMSSRSLFEACSGHVRATIPPPDPTPWHSIADPSERLETALRELYGYYERLEPLLENVQRDAAVMPLVAEMNAYRAHQLEEIRDVLLQAWPRRGDARARVRRAIGHALEFRTWQSLVRRHGCATDEAVQLMVAFACAAGSGDANAKAKARL